MGVQRKMAHSANRKERKVASKRGLRTGVGRPRLLPELMAGPRPSMAAGTAAAVDRARAAVFADIVSARVLELELRKKKRESISSDVGDARSSIESLAPGILDLVDGDMSRNMRVQEEVVFEEDEALEDDENKSDEEEENNGNDEEKSSHILPITIPHGFQLMRTMIQSKPSVKTVINVSSNNTDSFAVLDSSSAQLLRGTVRVASISVGEERSVPDSHLTGLNKWIYISKFKVTVIATLHLELKVLGLSLELLSQTSSIKPVLCLEFQEEKDEIIAGGVGNIRIWTISQTKGTFRLTGPRLVIDDLATEEWITHTATNAYLHRLMVACDCDLLIYDYNTGKRIERLKGIHELSISAMIFFTPHQYLITASKDSTIKVWTRYNQFILELKSQTSSPVTGMAIANPDDQETVRHPFLLSSYLDGTIRMWNLENGHCVYRLFTFGECLGLDWLRPDVFFHYSRDRICVWNLNRKYVSFSTITSAVNILRRIEVPGSKPRILAVAEDASIKLLSPVTGATLLTAFPVIKDSLIRSVEYDIVSNMLWTLTHSGDLFVYSTVMNPCKVVDEWKVQPGRDLITCMSAFRIAPKGGKRSLTNLKTPAVYTLFGGTDSGQVVTLDIRLIGGEMKILTQAHTATISAISCCSEKMQLVTAATGEFLFGKIDELTIDDSDGLIKLWSISWTNKMDTTSKDAENPDLCLQLLPYATANTNAVVKLPKGYATNISLNVGSETAAFASETTLLTLFNWNYKGFSDMKKKHAADEDHLKRVTFVSSLASLHLFATSSEDGTAKIWDAIGNSLIREIQFNEPISSIGFCNEKGDLLIGLPNQLVLVRVHDYLPNQFLADLIIKPDGWPDDPIEVPKLFDSELDFWELYRHGLEKIGADLTKWHIAFRKRSHDEDKLTEQIEDLERKMYDAEENIYEMHMKKKGKFLQVVEDVLRNDQHSNDSDEEHQPKTEISSSKEESKSKPKSPKRSGATIPASKIKPATSRVSIGKKPHRAPAPTLTAATKTARLAQVSRQPNEKPQAKKLFPGRSKSWIQNHFMKLGLMPNSIIAGEMEGEKVRRERLDREKKAAEALQKMQELANAKAMAERVRKIKGGRQLPIERKRSMRPQHESDVNLEDDDEFTDGHHQPFIPFDEPSDVVDLEEIERRRKEAEEAGRLRRLAELEDEKRRAAELEAELRAQRERDAAELKVKRDEEERLKRERAEAEEAERRKLAEEKDAKRKAELEAKLAVKRAKKEAMDAILAAKKAAEAAEAERLKKLEMERRNSAKPTTSYGAVKDFAPTTPDHSEKKTIAQDVFSAREKGALYKAPPPPTIKKSERKPTTPWKRRHSERVGGINIPEEESDSMLGELEELEEEDDFDPQAISDLWNSTMNGAEIAKTAWNLIGVSKKNVNRKSTVTEPANELRPEFRNIIGTHWFPGLDPGMEANLTNIIKVLFRTMKTGLWREKSEACKAVLYLNEVVRKSAKKSLTDMGINSRDSLKQAMIDLQMIPDQSDKRNEMNLQDFENSKQTMIPSMQLEFKNGKSASLPRECQDH
ncbi:UNVERIFIED_CONTAM: WD repeat-containing protein 87 [Siphonaria sp. JEL0065]|nr:WD repeat-containing protein 87 [Siphonaria sp. JEL0065]